MITPPTIPVAQSTLVTSNSTVMTEQKKAMLAITSKLNAIEEKSSCGGVVFLDKVANFLDRCSVSLHRLAEKVRNRTTKMQAPCSIKFKGKNAS